MRIKINLEYVLEKNRISLKDFLEKNAINTYDHLLEYCNNANMNPVDRQAFDAVVKLNVNEPKKETSVDEKSKKDTKKGNTRRAASETQSKKRGRPRTKKVKSS